MSRVSSIGKWSVQAGVDAQGMTTGVNRISQDATRMEQRVNRSFQNMHRQTSTAMSGIQSRLSSLLTGAAGGVAGALGVNSLSGIFGNFSRVFNEEIDLGFLNDQLGTSIEWLSALRTVAMENSVSAEQFATGMNRLNMTIGNAATGGTEALETFRDLGINFQQFRGLEFQQQFLMVADALVSIENRSVRARLAMELFGRGEGQRMLRSIMSPSGIAGAVTEALGRGAGTTEQALQHINEMDNAIDRMSTTWRNTWRDFLGTTAPLVTSWLNGLRAPRNFFSLLGGTINTAVASEQAQSPLSQQLFGGPLNALTSGLSAGVGGGISGGGGAMAMMIGAGLQVLQQSLPRIIEETRRRAVFDRLRSRAEEFREVRLLGSMEAGSTEAAQVLQHALSPQMSIMTAMELAARATVEEIRETNRLLNTHGATFDRMADQLANAGFEE